jgi:hypothetical protein
MSDLKEASLNDRGADLVKPGLQVTMPGSSKGGSAQLFGKEPAFNFLGRVSSFGENARTGL